MNPIQKILDALKKAGIIKDTDQTKIDEALKDIDINDNQPVNIDTSKFDASTKQVVDTLVDSVNSLKKINKDLLDSLTEEKSARQAVNDERFIFIQDTLKTMNKTML